MLYIEKNEYDSIYHDIIGRFGASKVLLKPAPAGTGVIAGGAMRAVLELAGVRNIVAKSIGSNNKHNVVNATMEGLRMLKTPKMVARLRGKTIEEITQ
jgi:small subunit ribosomal protein S5